MQIYCRVCASEIPAANINIDTLIAKCAVCNAVFSIADEIERRQEAEAEAKAKEKKFLLPQPYGIVVDESPDTITITRRWMTASTWFTLLFAVVWNAFLLFWYSMAFSFGTWIMLVFPLLHVAVGIFMAYNALTGLLNRTVITLSHAMLTVVHTPIPAFGGNKSIESARINEVYTRPTPYRVNRQEHYTVYAVLVDGQQVALVGHLADHHQAIFIESEIQEFYGLKNRVIPGELGV